MTARYDVVIPTIGRASLETLLRALAEGDGPAPGAVIVVDDRPCCELAGPLPLGVQLIAAPFREPVLLRVAARLEADGVVAASIA